MNVLIRVDFSFKIGLGHLKRMLSLADRLKESGFEVYFASKHKSKYLAKYKVYKIYNNEKKELNKILNKLKANLLIIDGYDIDNKMDNYFKSFVIRIDDLGYSKANLVINPNPYKISNAKNYLFGRDCILLDKSFLKKLEEKEDKNEVVLFFGGTDILNLSFNFSKRLLALSYKVTVLTSSLNKNLNKLKNLNINLIVDCEDIAKILKRAFFIISATGTSVYELISLNKAFINIITASNQKNIAKFLKENNLSYQINNINDLDINKFLEKKGEIIKNQEKFFKYYNPNRIIEEIKLRLFNKTYIKEIKAIDIMEVFKLVNEKEVRKNSLSISSINIKEHYDWFNLRLKNKYFYKIVDIYDNFLGFIRFDKNKDKYIVSIALKKVLRASKKSCHILKKTIKLTKLNKFFAYVKDENKASLNLFLNIGFKEFKTQNNIKILKYENS